MVDLLKPAHQKHVSRVLQRLRDHSFLKADKCLFHQKSGYIVNEQWLQMDDGKVAAVISWPTPQTVKELQGFLCFAILYRRFINNYSSITSSLPSLLKGKPKSLSWNLAFQTLKSKFISALHLRHPNPDLAFIIVVDASTTGMSGDIGSKEHDICS